MQIKATFKGTTNLRNKAAALQRAISSSLESVATAAAQPFLDEAQRLCPVGPGTKDQPGGYLRDHIHIETGEKSDTRVTVRCLPVYPAGNRWGWDPPYALRIEQGFEGPDSLGRVYHQAPEPYMRPAWDGKQEAVRQAARDGLRAVVAAI